MGEGHQPHATNNVCASFLFSGHALSPVLVACSTRARTWADRIKRSRADPSIHVILFRIDKVDRTQKE
jgi:hypothetical protein